MWKFRHESEFWTCQKSRRNHYHEQGQQSVLIRHIKYIQVFINMINDTNKKDLALTLRSKSTMSECPYSSCYPIDHSRVVLAR